MGLRAMVLSAIAGTAGAVMYWTITYQSTGFHLSTIGLNVISVGAFDLIVPTSIVAVSRRPSGGSRHSLDRHVVYGDGQTRSVNEVSP